MDKRGAGDEMTSKKKMKERKAPLTSPAERQGVRGVAWAVAKAISFL
jgi:hypothetical protein